MICSEPSAARSNAQTLRLATSTYEQGRLHELEGILANRVAGHLAGDRYQRHAVHVRIGDRRHQVGGSRAGGDQADADASSCARVSVRHVSRALLVSHQDMPDSRFG